MAGVACHADSMSAYTDPYARLATLLWLLKPDDVARLVGLAEKVADARLADFLVEGGAGPGQATQRPQNRS